MAEEKWIETDYQLPPDGVIVWAMDSSGTIRELKRLGRLWFVPDGSLYVYFTPVFWKSKND